jgi:hypothetical protein
MARARYCEHFAMFTLTGMMDQLLISTSQAEALKAFPGKLGTAVVE